MDMYPETFNVEVTQSEINSGRRFAAGSCPIALAMERCLGTHWVVDHQTATPFDEYGRVLYEHDAREFVLDFDAGKVVQPGVVTFVLAKAEAR